MMRTRNMVVSLIGRPNVGKSSLFNALMGKQHKSITFDEPGVTRDRHYGITSLNPLGKDEASDIILVDTGGFYPERIEETEENRDKFFNIMTGHAKTAIAESDLVLMIVDVREGALPYDRDIANFIRAQGKEFWLIMNKYDTDKQAGSEVDFYQIPVDDYFLTSAAHNVGITTIKERIQEKAIGFAKTKPSESALSQGITPREDVVARVALIGAPNAGKSTLLNNLVGAERALVSDIPGTTVDPIEGYFDLFFGEQAALLQGDMETSKNDKALFQQYEDFRSNNPDVYSRIVDSYFLEEDIGDPEQADFIDDLDEISEAWDEESESFIYEEEEEIAGEANDSQSEVLFSEESDDSESLDENATEGKDENLNTSFWRSVHLVDTAGIRRKSNIKDFVESQSVFRSLRCISESDIVIFMVDSTKGIGHQDRRLMDIALEKGKSVIVCMNKMDLLKSTLKTEKERMEWLEELRYKVPWLNFCDILPISAKKNTGLKRLKKTLVKTIFVRRKMVGTSELNRFVFSMLEKNPVVVNRSGGRRLKVKYVSQVKAGPPTFLFFTNRSKGIPENYKRYLRNGLRRTFELDNTPVHLVFRTGTDLEKRMKKIGRK
ncbi:MAG: GTPase [Bdellovibrionota bacterium]|nr:GTPase [Bdellovibrionota bacterium]